MLSLVTLNVVMLNVANDALMLSLILLKVMLSAVAPLLSLAPPRSGYFFTLSWGIYYCCSCGFSHVTCCFLSPSSLVKLLA
jgi:hypothetical protein